jgi:hypothetical protein
MIVDGFLRSSTLEQSLCALQLCLPTVDERERPALWDISSGCILWLPSKERISPDALQRSHGLLEKRAQDGFQLLDRLMAIGNSEESVRDMDVSSQPRFVTTNDAEQPFGTEN